MITCFAEVGICYNDNILNAEKLTADFNLLHITNI